MTHGRQLRLYLADGTSSGPRYYEIVNRTIQAMVIPVTRIADVLSDEWKEFQKPGVYLVQGATQTSARRLYIGKGENVAKRVQGHPDKLDFDVETLLLVTSKDENLNASQVGWLESKLIHSVNSSKRIVLQNIQHPDSPLLAKPELATVAEFIDDLILMAQTAGFDFFTPPKEKKPLVETEAAPEAREREVPKPDFILSQPSKGITAYGFPSDEGFVVKRGSEAIRKESKALSGGYSDLRSELVSQGVLAPKPGEELTKYTFTIDYAFAAPSSAAAVVVGSNNNGKKSWKTASGESLGDYLDKRSSALLIP